MEAQLGFNKVYQQYPGVDMFSRIIVANDTIFAVGVAYDSTEVPSPQQVLTTKTDTFGHIIKTKLLS